MQDPNLDTEWNDILRAKGILPPKQTDDSNTLTEEDVIKIVEDTVQQKLQGAKKMEDMTLEELDELEDEEDERVFLEYRKKRLAEMQAQAKKSKFGDVREISAQDYVAEVNNAGEGIWVVLHLYKSGIPLCSLINDYLYQLAAKFPATKFLKSISTTCIPNFPDKNLPAIFIYFENQLKKQIIGPLEFGGTKLKIEELEWMLAEVGAVQTDLESDPRPKTRDVLFTSLRQQEIDEDNDW